MATGHLLYTPTHIYIEMPSHTRTKQIELNSWAIYLPSDCMNNAIISYEIVLHEFELNIHNGHDIEYRPIPFFL